MKRNAFFISILIVGSCFLNAQNKLYWVDYATNKVQRSNLDGSSVEDIRTGEAAPVGIAVDSSGGKIYFGVSGKIRKANLDGTGAVDLVTGLSEPCGIALEGMSMGGLPGTVSTDASGNYSGTVDYDWSGTVTPAKAGYSFTPAAKDYANVISNQTGQDYTALATSAIPQLEREALIALYNSTNGASWTDSSGWKTPPLHTDGFALPGTEGGWYGITVLGDHVTEIIIDTNNMLGSLPAEIGNLASMTRLIMQQDGLTGSIPTEIGNLSNLTILNLSQNSLSGSIPAGIGSLTNLVTLYLHQNDLIGGIPAEIGNLTNLVSLNLIGNSLDGGIPVEIGNLIKLQVLYLTFNRMRGEIPVSLTNLINLTNTSIIYNALHASDAGLITFLNAQEPNWADTQTIAPTNVTATPVNSTTINLAWDAITFTGQTGGYRIFASTTSGSGYVFYQQTGTKSVTSMTVNGLTPGTPYYFVIQTRTNPHGTQQKNTVDSENSAEATATTFPAHTVTFETDGTPEATLTGNTSQTVNHGSNCTAVTANVPIGYTFVNWTGTGGFTSTDNPVTVSNVTQDMTVTANYAPNQYMVTFQTDGTPGATLTGNTSQTVNYGDDCTAVTANNPLGYHLVNWTGTDDFLSTDNPLTVTNVRADMQLTANFSINTYVISGTIKVGADPLSDVVMNGLPGSPKTNASGFYTATVEYGWSGMVTPAKTNYTFTPQNMTYTSVSADQAGQNYIAVLSHWVAITAPNGGESWPLGSSKTITWNYYRVSGDVRLVLFRNDVKVGVIATVPIAQKVYYWVAGAYVGGAAVAAKNYKIKVVTVDGAYSDFSDANFTLNLDPYVRVATPNGGESWAKGGVRTITWISRGVSGNVRVVLYSDSAKENVIATVAASPGSYNWTVGNYIGGTAPAGTNYKIKVVTVDSVYRDYSDQPFAITAAGGGLLAHYKLDGDGRDANGNGLDALLQGPPQPATDRFGYVDGSLAFDAGNTWMEVKLRENEALIGEEGFAACGWIRIGAVEQARGIWSVADAGEWLALELRADRRLVLRMSAANSELLSTVPLATGRWVFVVVQFDLQTNRSRLYVDGVLAAETVQMPVLPGRGRHIILAHTPAAGYLGGALDDFRFYRRPLADGEIKGLLEEKREGGDLLAYYPLDGDARDNSGNERHGDSVGALGVVDRHGRSGSALRSEGLSLPGVAATERAGGFTMNLWIRSDAAGRWQTLCGEEGGGLVLRLSPENRLELELAGKRFEYEKQAAKGWVMVTLVDRVEAGVMEIYRNGRLTGRVARPETGMFSGSWLTEFAGAVDDARFYQRALTVEEIGKHYIENN